MKEEIKGRETKEKLRKRKLKKNINGGNARK